MAAFGVDWAALRRACKRSRCGVDAGLGTLLFDLNQIAANDSCWRAASSSAVDCVQFDVSGGGVESHLLPSVLEGQVGGFNTGAGSLGVLALREKLRTSDCMVALPTEGWPVGNP